MASLCTYRVVETGEDVFREGEEGDEMYIISMGSVGVFLERNGIRESICDKVVSVSCVMRVFFLYCSVVLRKRHFYVWTSAYALCGSRLSFVLVCLR